MEIQDYENRAYILDYGLAETAPATTGFDWGKAVGDIFGGIVKTGTDALSGVITAQATYETQAKALSLEQQKAQIINDIAELQSRIKLGDLSAQTELVNAQTRQKEIEAIELRNTLLIGGGAVVVVVGGFFLIKMLMKK